MTIRVRHSLVLALLVLPMFSSFGLAQIKVTPAVVKETRRSDGFFNSLEVQLKIEGDALKGAKGIRIAVAKALDDSGKDLLKEEKEEKRFQEVDSTDQSELKIDVELKNTDRSAKVVREISGNLEIFSPQRDPKSIITVPGFLKLTGKTIPNPILKSAGVEVTVWTKEMFEARKKAEEEKLNKEMEAKTKKAEQSGKLEDAVELLGEGLAKIFGGMFDSFAQMEENDIAFNVKDAGKKLISIEFEDENGKPIERGGRMTIGGDPRTMIYSFKEKLRMTTRIRLYVLTPRSVSAVPFKLANVPLP